MMNLNEVSFHEATILAFQRDSNDIFLKLENIIFSEKIYNAKLLFLNIKSISDGSHVLLDNQFMLFDDGEILSVLLKNNFFEILIEWIDYRNKKYETKFYQIECEKLSIEIL